MELKTSLAHWSSLLDRESLLQIAEEKIRLATDMVVARERTKLLEDFCKAAWKAKTLPYTVVNISRTHFKHYQPAIILSDLIVDGSKSGRICFFEQNFGYPEKQTGACSPLWFVGRGFAGISSGPEEPLTACPEHLWTKIKSFLAKEYKEDGQVRIETIPGFFPVRILITFKDNSRGDWLLVIEAKDAGLAVRRAMAREKTYAPKSRLEKVSVFDGKTWKRAVFSDEENPTLISIDPQCVEFSLI